MISAELTSRNDERASFEQLPDALRDWMTLERFHLHKPELFQRQARDPGFDTRYFPQNSPLFRLPCYWVRRKHLHIYGDQDEAPNQFGFDLGHTQNDPVLFPIHPSALEDFQPFLRDTESRDAYADGCCWWALPTSSTRTLLVWPEGRTDRAVFVKTSLHSEIFGGRRITRIKAGRAIGLNRLVRQASAWLPPKLHVLPEVVGFSTRHAIDSGAIVRTVPQEIKEDRARVAPLFSLLGGDKGRVPLLLKLLERTDLQPVRFVDELLCASFAPLWADLALRHGLILEAHGQDLLLGLSPEGTPTGHFYYRDLEGLQVDWDLRRRLGWPSPDLPNAWAWRETYGTWGYRYCDFLWYKWHISLFGYLRLVLAEVEISLAEWHDAGSLRGPRCADGELTMLFSRHLFAAIERQWNVRMGEPYDILRSLNRFVAALLRVRKALLS